MKRSSDQAIKRSSDQAITNRRGELHGLPCADERVCAACVFPHAPRTSCTPPMLLLRRRVVDLRFEWLHRRWMVCAVMPASPASRPRRLSRAGALPGGFLCRRARRLGRAGRGGELPAACTSRSAASRAGWSITEPEPRLLRGCVPSRVRPGDGGEAACTRGLGAARSWAAPACRLTSQTVCPPCRLPVPCLPRCAHAWTEPLPSP